jgi:hypothetical protein
MAVIQSRGHNLFVEEEEAVTQALSSQPVRA